MNFLARVFLATFFLSNSSIALERNLHNLSTALQVLVSFLEQSPAQKDFYAKFAYIKALSKNIPRLQEYSLEQLKTVENRINELREIAVDAFGTEVPQDVEHTLDVVQRKAQERRAAIIADLLRFIPTA